MAIFYSRMGNLEADRGGAAEPAVRWHVRPSAANPVQAARAPGQTLSQGSVLAAVI